MEGFYFDVPVTGSTRATKTYEEVKMTPSKMFSDCRLDAKESFECMEKYDKATAKVITAAVIRRITVVRVSGCLLLKPF